MTTDNPIIAQWVRMVVCANVAKTDVEVRRIWGFILSTIVFITVNILGSKEVALYTSYALVIMGICACFELSHSGKIYDSILSMTDEEGLALSYEWYNVGKRPMSGEEMLRLMMRDE